MNTTDMTVANEILRQLGGSRFVAMTGAKDILGGPNRLQFQVGRGAKDGINKVRITLDPSDTYTVQFFKMGRAPLFEIKTVAEFSDVYADSLRQVFESATGFYTSL